MKFDYMTEIEHTVPYYQFPKFLLELPLPQNARILYMLLYDRSRISLKNRWADTETGNEPPSRREYGSAAGELTDSHTVRSAENL